MFDRGIRVAGTGLRKSALVLAVVVAGYALAAGLCIALTRETAGIATVWLANAVLAVGMMVLPRRWGWAAAALCFGVNTGANLLGGDAIGASLTFACINIAESIVSAALGRRILGPRLRVSGMKRLGLLIALAALGVSAISAVVAAAIFHQAFGRSFYAVFIDWLFADGLGSAMMMTALLILRQSWNQPSDGKAGALESMLLIVAMPALSTINYLTVREPLMFLVFPLMVLVAFRM
ncbi:MAG: hypothetical protein JWM33_1058, partial [Caulobacteraceae bacterium]|nr:hypothetical protein [Caulobacteraceae bacterium]